jgi:hypothetical protein
LTQLKKWPCSTIPIGANRVHLISGRLGHEKRAYNRARSRGPGALARTLTEQLRCQRGSTPGQAFGGLYPVLVWWAWFIAASAS